jgi:hypothetical protein
MCLARRMGGGGRVVGFSLCDLTVWAWVRIMGDGVVVGLWGVVGWRSLYGVCVSVYMRVAQESMRSRLFFEGLSCYARLIFKCLR